MNTNKALTYSSFGIAAIFVVLAFLTAKSYTQLGIAVVLYPALAYFAFKIFPRATHPSHINAVPVQARPVERVHEVRTERVTDVVVDLDKRTFLKLVGSVGVSFFVFSLLGQKVGNLLFGNSLGGGVNQSASIGSTPTGQGALPTAGYSVTEIDQGDISYYGFTNVKGGWLIMRNDSSDNSFRYAKGDSGFPGNWANRKNLKYDYYYNLF